MRVLICGGGVIGAAIAYFASLKRADVLVIERSRRRVRGVGQVGRVSCPRLV